MQDSLESRLEEYRKIIQAVILSKQDPCTGLLPASTEITEHGNYRDAWVRDNVYSILAVWGLALGFRKIDDHRGRGFELEKAVIKLMRGLLFAMMQQSHKVEKFKHTQAPQDSLHAKYSTSTGQPVVGDFEWGHLQVDATSLFILILAQMTASGIIIIFSMDEVNFVQNLVFYIERSYRVPDYGIWERGNKINSGNPELNTSSIGMATAALEAIAGINLFGAHGGPASVIHVLLDEISRNERTVSSFLPRESKSKEIDAALLSIISFPAFAIADEELITRTRNEIFKKLEGNYGCKRFLLDGHQTAIEDTNRLHYEPYELKKFKRIECEWPLFFTYLILDGIFRNDQEQVKKFREKLKPLLIRKEINGVEVDLVPELYYVPEESIAEERKNPGSQKRLPNKNVPLVWAQSLNLLGEMLTEGLISVGEIDPLNRHSKSHIQRSKSIVQVALLAEDQKVCELLNSYGLETQTPAQIEPIQLCIPSQLRDLYVSLGENSKLGLTGRPPRPIGALSTCKIYRLRGKIYVFTPRFMQMDNSLAMDNDLLVSLLESEILFIANNWNLPGRPTMTLLLKRSMFSGTTNRLLEFMTSLKTGECAGVRIKLGPISTLMYTGNISVMDEQFANDPEPVKEDPCLLKSSNNLYSIRRSLSISDMNNAHDSCEYTTPTGERSPEMETTLLDMESDDQINFAIEQLKITPNVYEQTAILRYLNKRKGLDFDLGFATVKELLEELFQKVTASKNWPIVRQVSGELESLLDNVAIGVISILVHQMQLTLGEPNNELIVSDSSQGLLHPTKLKDAIFSRYSNKQEACLVQEIILYSSSFLNGSPSLFSSIKRIRINFIIIALREELCRLLNCQNQNQQHRLDHLLSLSPYEIKELLNVLLNSDQSISRSLEITAPQLVKLHIVSGGFDDGNTSRCTVQGEVGSKGNHSNVIDFVETGINVLVFSKSGNMLSKTSFDTHTSTEGSQKLAQFLQNQEADNFIIATVKDEASAHITEEVYKAFEQLGSTQIRNLKFRDSWAFATLKGNPSNNLEVHKATGSGPAEIHTSHFIGCLEPSLSPSNGLWYHKRQIDGAINRTPPDFYSKVWNLLKKSDGISVYDHTLPREPTVLEMTRGEWQFAIRVERLLDNMTSPVDRAMAVEALTVVSEIHSRNPELGVSGVIPINKIMSVAVDLCWKAWHPDLPFDLSNATKLLYDLPPEGQNGSLKFLGKSAIQTLSYDVASECNAS